MDKRMETVKQVWNFSLRSVWSRYYRQLQFLNRHRHIRTFIYMYPYTSTYRCRELLRVPAHWPPSSLRWPHPFAQANTSKLTGFYKSALSGALRHVSSVYHVAWYGSISFSARKGAQWPCLRLLPDLLQVALLFGQMHSGLITCGKCTVAHFEKIMAS